VLLGEGEVPVGQILALLAARGYRRWISVERERHWHPRDRTTRVALRQYLAMLGEVAQAGRYGGFSGPEGFRQASQALKFLLNEASISWR